MRRLLAAAVLLAAAAPVTAQADQNEYEVLCVQASINGLPPVPRVCVPIPIDI